MGNDELNKKKVYSPYDVAAICGVPYQDALDWFARGDIKTFEVPGRHKRVSHDDLEAWLGKNHLALPARRNGTFSKFKVLIVEDDPDLLEIFAELLKDERDVEVHTEDQGFSAGLQIASWHPDLIMLDFLMPGVNGFDICKRIRSDLETADIPVLAVTSLSTYDNRKAVMDSGVSDFLGKPFYSEDLLQKVRILLGLEKMAARPTTVREEYNF